MLRWIEIDSVDAIVLCPVRYSFRSEASSRPLSSATTKAARLLVSRNSPSGPGALARHRKDRPAIKLSNAAGLFVLTLADYWYE